MPPPSKKRKVENRVEEISFDPDAREDYLSGFRKRKQQRIKHAQEQAAKQDRVLRIESRKVIRDQRRKDLETHVQTVNEILKKSRAIELGHEESSDDSNAGSDADDVHAEPEAEEGMEEEYIDEGKYTTVTVEPMKLSEDDDSGAEGSGGANEADNNGKAKGQGEAGRKPPDGASKGKRVWTKEKPTTSKPKKKKAKFRYESKVERRATRSKQAEKNSAAARARRGAAE